MGDLSNGNYKIYCAANKGKNRWLIPDQNEVTVSPRSTVTWQLEITNEGVTLSANGGYVAGNTKEGKVRLTSLENGGSGAYWTIDLIGDYYVIRCLDMIDGDRRYLDGHAEDAYVYLNDDTEKSGSQWLLIPA